MLDNDKTREQLLSEVEDLRRRVAGLEGADRERRRAEEELAKSKAILTAAIECLPFDFFALNREGQCILQNAVSRRYYGNTVGKTAEQVCPDERVLPHWLEGNRRALAGEKVEEEIGLLLGGERRTFYSVLAPIRDGDTLYGVLGVNVDITERKRAEEALRLSEGRYRALAESTKDIIFILNRQGTLLYANQAAAQCIGIPSDEIGGKQQADLFPPEMARSQIEKIGRVFASGEVIAYDDLFHFGPAEVWLRIHLIPLRDETGQITAVMGVCHNITDRKLAEAALRESEQRFRAIFDQAPLGIALVDSHSGRFVQINRSYCEIAGRTREEMLTLDFQSITHPATLQADIDNMARVLEGKIHSFDSEKRYLRPDGSTVWIALTVVALWHEGERPRYHVAMVQDITDRKRAEAALQKAHGELERRVEERTAELAHVNEELALFRKFADASGQGFSMADLDGHITYLNPALCRMLGEERPEDRIGRHLSTCHTEESNLRGKEEIEHALEQRGYWEGELTMLSCQGRSFPTWQSSFLIRDDQGNPLRFAVVITDITERKAAEEALRRSQATLDAFFNASTAILNIFDDAFRYIKTDNLTPTYFGLDAQSIIGQSLRDLAPGFIQQYGPMLQRVIETGEPVHNIEVQAPVPGRSQKIFYWRASYFPVPLPDGKRGYGVVGVEINDRKRAEEALRQSERRFRNYFEQGLIGMAVTSLDKRWLEVNDRLCEIVGYSREELLQRKWTDLTFSDDLEPNARLFDQLVAGQIEYFILDKRYRKKDASIVYATIHTRAIRRDDGTIDHIVTLVENITARKQAEEALERERQSLWRMLQASDHERQIISYEIHDGLTQYLAAAGMQFQVFDGLRVNKPKEAKKAYETATQLVRQSHAEARRLISEVRPPVIDEIGLETAISHLVHEQRERGGPKIEYQSNVQFGRLPPILENALYRIVQEALTNACKHGKSKRVTVSMTQQRQDVQLEVQDWGIGFDPATVEKGHFGLEGIRQRVRLLGGRLTIKSTPGSGTLLQVVVPILERQAEE